MTVTVVDFPNDTQMVLNEGVGGFRVGNTQWLFEQQAQIVNPSIRISQPEISTGLNISLQPECTPNLNADP